MSRRFSKPLRLSAHGAVWEWNGQKWSSDSANAADAIEALNLETQRRTYTHCDPVTVAIEAAEFALGWVDKVLDSGTLAAEEEIPDGAEG